MTPSIPPAIARDLCNILGISISHEYASINPNFSAMSHKVMTYLRVSLFCNTS